MSKGETQIPIPYVWFCVGFAPWVILLLVFLFYEPVGHADPFIFLVFLVGIFAIVVTPICFLRGFLQYFKFTGKHRYIGLSLNSLGLGALAFMLIYGLLAN